MLSHLTYSGHGRIASAIRMRAADERRREHADALATFELVLESVHPGNLGPLPPSPDKLRSKAYLLGLI